MWTEARLYLSELSWRLKLDPRRKREIIQELETHVEDGARAFEEGGLDPGMAQERSLEQLGRLQDLVQCYYAVHSRTPWAATFLAALPHFLFSLLFAMHLWTAGIWVVLLLVGIVGVTLLAWRGGQPDWLYPWLGYSLVPPVIGGGLAVVALGNGMWGLAHGLPLPLPLPAYAALILFLPVAFVAVKKVWKRVIERDWLFASVAALPFPFVALWLRFMDRNGGLFSYDSRRLMEVDGATALLFLGLALTTAVVYRLSHRSMRVATLTLAVPLLIVLGALSYYGSALSITVFLLLVLALGALALPAVEDSRHNPNGRHRVA